MSLELPPPAPAAHEQQAEPEAAIYPGGKALKDIFKEEVTKAMPAAAREAGAREQANVIADYYPLEGESPTDVNDPANLAKLQGMYRYQTVDKLTANSWWPDTLKLLQSCIADPADRAVPIVQKHTVHILSKDKDTGQSYGVYEAGEKADPEDIKTVVDTLNVIDQFSGGALTPPDRQSRIVLYSGGPWISPGLTHDNFEGMGRHVTAKNGQHAVLINLSGTKKLAEQEGVSSQELLATFLTHELLGHGLEAQQFGKTGVYFKQHFDYSDEKVPGDIVSRVHESIAPKDTQHSSSKPVREYGAVNASEDFATATDSMVSSSMGWSGAPGGIERHRSERDAHRENLVLNLQLGAVAMAAMYPGNPGFVGSSIEYERDDSGNVVGIAPERTLHVDTQSGAEALKQDIAELMQRYANHTELVVAHRQAESPFV